MSNPQADRLAAWLADNPDITQQDALEGLCKRFRTEEEDAWVEQAQSIAEIAGGAEVAFEVQIDPFALASIAFPGESGENGAWVQAWVWIPGPDEEESDELYTEDNAGTDADPGL